MKKRSPRPSKAAGASGPETWLTKPCFPSIISAGPPPPALPFSTAPAAPRPAPPPPPPPPGRPGRGAAPRHVLLLGEVAALAGLAHRRVRAERERDGVVRLRGAHPQQLRPGDGGGDEDVVDVVPAAAAQRGGLAETALDVVGDGGGQQQLPPGEIALPAPRGEEPEVVAGVGRLLRQGGG